MPRFGGAAFAYLTPKYALCVSPVPLRVWLARRISFGTIGGGLRAHPGRGKRCAHWGRMACALARTGVILGLAETP